MSDIYFSDEELVAYLDGETEHAPAQKIASALKTDPVLAKRLEALRLDTNQIAQCFETSLDHNKMAPFVYQAPARARLSRLTIAASLLALAIGFGVGQQVFPKDERDWQDYVAAYHFLYTTKTLSSVSKSETLQQQELDQVSAAISKKIALTTLKEFPEVEYKRAQVLGYKGQALVQFTFLSSTGEPIALCILRTGDRSEQELELSEMESMSAAKWNADGYEYLLIGGQDSLLIERMAANFIFRNV